MIIYGVWGNLWALMDKPFAEPVTHTSTQLGQRMEINYVEQVENRKINQSMCLNMFCSVIGNF